MHPIYTILLLHACRSDSTHFAINRYQNRAKCLTNYVNSKSPNLSKSCIRYSCIVSTTALERQAETSTHSIFSLTEDFRVFFVDIQFKDQLL